LDRVSIGGEGKCEAAGRVAGRNHHLHAGELIAHRHRKLDRALPGRNLGIWIVTILILVAGSAIIIANADREGRVRMLALERIAPGDPGQTVTAALGTQPRRCPAGDLDHLRASFPEGWPQGSVDVALERLAERTDERWLFNADASPVEHCGPEPRQAEIGIDSAGNVVWILAIRGRSALRLPPWATPAGAADPPAAAAPAASPEAPGVPDAVGSDGPATSDTVGAVGPGASDHVRGVGTASASRFAPVAPHGAAGLAPQAPRNAAGFTPAEPRTADGPARSAVANAAGSTPAESGTADGLARGAPGNAAGFTLALPPEAGGVARPPSR
jgi:hypothetical protein